MSISNKLLGTIEVIGAGIGGVVTNIFEAAKDSFDLIFKTVLPFMAFVAILITFVQETGLGNLIATALTPLSGSLLGLMLIALICGFPLISPILSPGAAVAQVVGVTVGGLIGTGIMHPTFALPALFAINVQVGCDSIPLMLSMQDAKDDTIKNGVPAFLISRQITGIIAVGIGYLFSIGLY